MGAPASSTTDRADRDAEQLRVFLGGVNHLPRHVERHRSDRRFVLAKEGGVYLDRCHVLGGDVDIFEDRVYRANDLALLAIDTDFGIDVELRRAGRRMNACNRTHLDAGAVVGAQAGDDVGHGSSLRSELQIYKFQNVDI